MTPAIIALLLLIPQIGIYGNEVFKADGDITSAGLISNIFVYGSMILEFILGIWTIVFCVIAECNAELKRLYYQCDASLLFVTM